nr:restriction endonuclease subunit S [Helicobacter pylori]
MGIYFSLRLEAIYLSRIIQIQNKVILITPFIQMRLKKKGLYGYSSFFIIKNKSITITSRGTIGVAFFRDYPYVPIGRLLVLQPKISNIDCRFYTEYINSKVKFNTEQTTIPQLTIPKVALCEIPLPHLNEQIAIANVLSDVDRYLYSLDALILKKESVKKSYKKMENILFIHHKP